jgi:hypothetical protein
LTAVVVAGWAANRGDDPGVAVCKLAALNARASVPNPTEKSAPPPPWNAQDWFSSGSRSSLSYQATKLTESSHGDLRKLGNQLNAWIASGDSSAGDGIIEWTTRFVAACAKHDVVIPGGSFKTPVWRF